MTLSPLQLPLLNTLLLLTSGVTVNFFYFNFKSILNDNFNKFYVYKPLILFYDKSLLSLCFLNVLYKLNLFKLLYCYVFMLFYSFVQYKQALTLNLLFLY